MLRAAAAIVIVIAAGLATYVAGEKTEVVVLRTFDADGAPHETKMWVVDHDGSDWVRVANPGREWFQRLSRNPRAELLRGGSVRPVVAHSDDSAATRAEIDRAFRAKYGAVDWWYGVLLRRGAVPVRLALAPSPSGSDGRDRSDGLPSGDL